MREATSQVESWPKVVLTGAQMLFVAFGALVLVPLLTGLDPSVALFTAGAGTLIFHAVTKQSVPVFLASSFAFIAPIQGSVASFGVPATMGGLMASGLVYVAISQAVRLKGTVWLHHRLWSGHFSLNDQLVGDFVAGRFWPRPAPPSADYGGYRHGLLLGVVNGISRFYPGTRSGVVFGAQLYRTQFSLGRYSIYDPGRYRPDGRAHW